MIMDPDHPLYAADPREFSEPPEFICDCSCPCSVHVSGPGEICGLCQDGECSVIVTETETEDDPFVAAMLALTVVGILWARCLMWEPAL